LPEKNGYPAPAAATSVTIYEVPIATLGIDGTGAGQRSRIDPDAASAAPAGMPVGASSIGINASVVSQSAGYN